MTPNNYYLGSIIKLVDWIFSFYGEEYKYSFLLLFILIVKFKDIVIPSLEIGSSLKNILDEQNLNLTNQQK